MIHGSLAGAPLKGEGSLGKPSSLAAREEPGATSVPQKT
jgi:hypothetical protein